MLFGRPQKFAVFELDVDGKRLIGNIDLGLRLYKAKYKTPWFLSLSTPLSEPTAEGLTTRVEAAELNQWEDAVEKGISGNSKFVFVGRVTSKGYRELLYYIAEPDRAVPALQRLIDSRSTRAFAFRCEQDPDWSKVRVYLRDDA